MSEAPDLIFAYGTLMQGLPLHHVIADQTELIEAGAVSGLLLDLGEFPAAVPDQGRTIHGEVYRLRSRDLLDVLDREEGYDPRAEDRSLYLRRPITVCLRDGQQVTAWIYWYRGDSHRAAPIPSGDYRRHLTDQALHR
ncbi:MAG: gamma-glutamylcyclotransferase [Candidatus Methylomirabilia bacterium]